VTVALDVEGNDRVKTSVLTVDARCPTLSGYFFRVFFPAQMYKKENEPSAPFHTIRLSMRRNPLTER